MAEGAPFTIGARARCSDGACGRVTQVVIDPVKKTVTHLIVEPDHREGLGRLVPIDRVKGEDGEVVIDANLSQFDSFHRAEETHFLPGIEGEFDTYDPEQVLLWPYFGGNTTVPVTVDALPPGEVAVRRGQEVQAGGGRVGEVEGLIVDPGHHRVTHLLLKEGHVFSHKDVAIPVSAVEKVEDDTVKVKLTKQEISALPAVDFKRSG